MKTRDTTLGFISGIVRRAIHVGVLAGLHACPALAAWGTLRSDDDISSEASQFRFTLQAPTLSYGGGILGDGSVVVLGQPLSGTAANEQYSVDVGLVPIAVAGGRGVACSAASNCADDDNNGIRDNNCVWWDCAGGLFEGTDISFADMGGPFGACPPDGFVNLFDRTHALTCFAGTNSCESANLDAGGSFGACPPDGFCNIFDAIHALRAFAGTNSCNCPGGASPESVPSVVGGVSLSLVASQRQAKPSDEIRIDVFNNEPLEELQAYQLHLGVTGGKAGTLELVDIRIEDHAHAVFSPSMPGYDAFNVAKAQMLKGLDAGGVPTPGKGYLATFTYRASANAAGTFVVDVLHDEAAGDQTFLVAGFTDKIEITQTAPAAIVVGR